MAIHLLYWPLNGHEWVIDIAVGKGAAKGLQSNMWIYNVPQQRNYEFDHF